MSQVISIPLALPILLDWTLVDRMELPIHYVNLRDLPFRHDALLQSACFLNIIQEVVIEIYNMSGDFSFDYCQSVLY